jgi:predicted HAD superfamily Cof-like phosphohydrolase
LNQWQQDVLAFHEAMPSTVGDFTDPAPADLALRLELMVEELIETGEAMGFNVEVSYWETATGAVDFPGMIDGLVDLLYVVIGTAVAAGVDLDPFWVEVQRANMAKAGGPVSASGKRLKPEGWTAPDIAGVLDRVVSSRDHA